MFEATFGKLNDALLIIAEEAHTEAQRAIGCRDYLAAEQAVDEIYACQESLEKFGEANSEFSSWQPYESLRESLSAHYDQVYDIMEPLREWLADNAPVPTSELSEALIKAAVKAPARIRRCLAGEGESKPLSGDKYRERLRDTADFLKKSGFLPSSASITYYCYRRPCIVIWDEQEVRARIF